LTATTGAETGNYSYDDAGNMISGNGFNYSWDLANRIKTSSDGATYTYDAKGQRLRKDTADLSTLHHYDGAGRLISETRLDGKKLRDYVYAGGRLISIDGKLK
jgi:YD repeat-containing protein